MEVGKIERLDHYNLTWEKHLGVGDLIDNTEPFFQVNQAEICKPGITKIYK